jgi:hypothetical protein
MKSLTFLLCLCFCTSLKAQSPLSFEKAIAQHKIKIHLRTTGGSQQLTVHFERLTDRPLRIVIPAGQLFLPADSTAQTLIAVKEEIFTLSKPKMFLQLKSYCSEAGDRSPSDADTFRMGRLASGPLLKMAEYISNHKLYSHPEVQYAIWCITNQHPVASLSHKGLLTTACQLLGQPIPDYSIKSAPLVEQPNRPVLPPSPLEINGVFTYEMKDSSVLSLIVFNEKNEKVKVFYEEKQHRPGKIKYTFSWKTTKMPHGVYEIRLLNREKIVKKMVVRY